MEKLIKLNIGAGSHISTLDRNGFINCDLYPGPGIDEVFDATERWPFEDNSVGMVRCNHVLEHLDNYRGFFKELHRCLTPNGMAIIAVPYGLGTGGMADVTHVRYWLPGSFTFLQPGYNEAVFNPQYDSWNAFFEVEATFLRIAGQMRWLVRWRPIRWLGLKILPHLMDSYSEFTVFLRALKTPEAIENFRQQKKGNAIPLQRVMHEYEFYGKPYLGGPVHLIAFDHGEIGTVRIATASALPTV